jgi:sigma-E factor negative regulatory protein RseB
VNVHFRRFRRPFAMGLVAATALAVVGPLRAWGAASGDADAREAAQLVTRARDAASTQEFAGRAVIRWAVGNSTRMATVDVRDENGSLAVVSGTHAVFDLGQRAYFRDPSGWTSVLIETNAQNLPNPGRHWDLSTGAGKTIAGRPTTLVIAARGDGSPAQRMFVDDATGLMLAREVLGADGHVERSVTFTSFEPGAPAPVDGPAHARPKRSQKLTSVPDAYRAPASPADGYELITRSRQPTGIALFYSDGVFSVSVFEQSGDLDWGALPAGGTTADLAGHRTRRYSEPNGTVLVWEDRGVVYTAVSDAPSDSFDQVVSGLASPDRSAPESVVDFVLGPFGWR